LRPTLLLLAAALLSACAAARVPAPPPAIAEVRACSAWVELAVAPDPGGRPQPFTARDSVTAHYFAGRVDVDPALGVGLPGTLRATWRDTLYRNADGTDASTWGRTVRFHEVAVGHWSTGEEVRRLPVESQVTLSCGERRAHAIDVPRTWPVRVTSDPAGASVFAHLPDGRGGEEERFLGTTPLDAELVWRPGRFAQRIRVASSGHADVVHEVRRTDDEVRIVLHPLPTHAP
jgi:hypothetical protein